MMESDFRYSRNKDNSTYSEFHKHYVALMQNIDNDIANKHQLLQVLQYAGRNPSFAEIDKLWKSYGSSISYKQLNNILRSMKSTSLNDITEVFKQFDMHGDGCISEAELFKLLTTRGEKMTTSEIKRIFKLKNIFVDGMLDYNELCKSILLTCDRCRELDDKQQLSYKRPLSATSRKSSSQGYQKEEEKYVKKLQPTKRRSVSKMKKVALQKYEDGISVKGPALTDIQPETAPSFKGWNHVSSKGCLYVDDTNNISSHEYMLELPSASNVYLTIKPISLSKQEVGTPNLSTDVGVFILRESDSSDAELISFTENKDNQQWTWRGDLRSGTYQIFPFSTGCHLKARKVDAAKEIQLIRKNESDEVRLSRALRDAISDIFEMCDLDSNGMLSRDEFNWYQMKTSNEEVDDEAWQVVLDDFHTEDEELTLEGFLQLHLMQAQEDDIDPQEELMDIVKSIGFNGSLIMDQACPFVLDIYTKDCKADLCVSSISSTGENISSDVMIRSIINQNELLSVKNIDDLLWHIYKSEYRLSTVLENKTSRSILVQADCSQTSNCLTLRGKNSFIVEVAPRSKMVLDHVLPVFERNEWNYHCKLSNSTKSSGSRRTSSATNKRKNSMSNHRNNSDDEVTLFD